MNVLGLFRKPATTATALRDKLAELRELHPKLSADARELSQKRSASLLTASEAEVIKIETALGICERERDRAAAAIEEVERRVVAAENDERNAELDRQRDVVSKRADEIAKRVRAEYEASSLKIVGLLNDLHAIEIEVSDLNRNLHAAGRGEDAVPSVETRVIDHGRNHEIVASLLNATALRPIGASPGWGKGAEQAGFLGLPTGMPKREG